MTLEKFAKENNFSLIFRQITEETRIRGRKVKIIRKKWWACELLSPFVEQDIVFHRKKGLSRVAMLVSGPLMPSTGKTRKEARGKFIAKISGAILKYGWDRTRLVKVPRGLQ